MKNIIALFIISAFSLTGCSDKPNQDSYTNEGQKAIYETEKAQTTFSPNKTQTKIKKDEYQTLIIVNQEFQSQRGKPLLDYLKSQAHNYKNSKVVDLDIPFSIDSFYLIPLNPIDVLLNTDNQPKVYLKNYSPQLMSQSFILDLNNPRSQYALELNPDNSVNIPNEFKRPIVNIKNIENKKYLYFLSGNELQVFKRSIDSLEIQLKLIDMNSDLLGENFIFGKSSWEKIEFNKGTLWFDTDFQYEDGKMKQLKYQSNQSLDEEFLISQRSYLVLDQIVHNFYEINPYVFHSCTGTYYDSHNAELKQHNWPLNQENIEKLFRHLSFQLQDRTVNIDKDYMKKNIQILDGRLVLNLGEYAGENLISINFEDPTKETIWEIEYKVHSNHCQQVTKTVREYKNYSVLYGNLIKI